MIIWDVYVKGITIILFKNGGAPDGSGEKKTLRMVTQYADACNLFAFMGNGETARKLDVLKGLCDAVVGELQATGLQR